MYGTYELTLRSECSTYLFFYLQCCCDSIFVLFFFASSQMSYKARVGFLYLSTSCMIELAFISLGETKSWILTFDTLPSVSSSPVYRLVWSNSTVSLVFRLLWLLVVVWDLVYDWYLCLSRK